MIPSTLRRAARALAATLLLATPLAHAQTPSTFNLPSQPLADSLRAVASATHTNVSFDEDLVAGVKAPALKGTMTAEEAVAKLIASAGLRYVKVSPRTISVVRASGASRGQKHESPSPGATGGPPAGPEGTELSPAPGSAPRTELSEVVVTGTHIHGAVSPSPTVVITREDIDSSGYTDVGDVVRSLPENFSAGNNPQVYLPNTPTQGNFNLDGGSSPNLRGLGPTSTLTLVDGHRLAQDGPTGTADISLIPLAAIDRIEVVTDSSSAAYGSDAVAGVVNFILRKDYEGAETSGTLGRATDGGGYERDLNQLFGHSWGSGGVIAVYEHERQDAVWSTQRDFTSTAASPSSLLPQSSRDSGFLSAHQDVTDSVSLFTEALYTSRIANNVLTYPASLDVGTFAASSSVRQYLADFGVNVNAPDEWKVSANASDAAQHSLATSTLLVPGAANATAYANEVYLGTTRAAELNADGPLWSFTTEAVRAAVGGGYRDEYLADSSVDLRVSRGVRYAFAELDAPLTAIAALRGLHELDLNVSGRYEGYTDLGGKVVPKVGLLLAPMPTIELRATWSEAFRAPTLSNLYSTSFVYAYVLPDPLSPTGLSDVLVRLGGNPQLRAETAKTWTTGIDWRPEGWENAKVGLSYYDVRYVDRVQSLSNVVTALTDPTNAPLITRDPSAALQQEIIDSANGEFINESGQPYDPDTIAAIVDARDLNIAEQDVSGVDVVSSCRFPLRASSLDAFVNGSYLQIRQRITPAAADDELAGLTYYPPRFHARGGLSWNGKGWAATVITNWTGKSINTYLPGMPSVGSWTTFDAQLSYTAPSQGPFAGLKASLSVRNILDRDPPFVQFPTSGTTGFNYDSNNVNPIGRFVSLQLVKEWFPKGTTE